ncbi:MAG: cation:proton antiporter [Candidatus Marsarchaeota archaeon]|jgi:cell volume regulation protein A|nr:cation:proton antiporter [Candidatus Marsarchaeota archaeon]
MLNVNVLFAFLAGVVFLGFILNALFDKLKVASVLPLMLIGLLIGPVFKVVSTGPSSTIVQLTPYITALALAFILFDVGLNMRFSHLRRVVVTATKFTFSLEIATGIVVAVGAFLAMHFSFGWSFAESLIFGFALAGPSAVIVPTLMKLIRMPEDLKTSLLYESVSSDMLELIVPIMLLQFIASTGIGLGAAIGTAFASIIFGAALGFIFAVVWLVVLNRFSKISKSYSWMLTIAMVLATYGVAELLGLSGAITIFVFGLAFGNLGSAKPDGTIEHEPTFIERYLSMPYDIEHVRKYQREIVFFTSTFFFVYIGMLFNVSQLNLMIVALALLLTLIFVLLRILFAPMLSKYMHGGTVRSPEGSIVYYNVARGLSPAIVATLPLAYGITIPSFLDAIFLVILVSNIAATVGIFAFYKPGKDSQQGTRPAVTPAA